GTILPGSITNGGSTSAASNPLTVGSPFSGGDFPLSDLAVWHTYALTSTDIGNLANRTNTPGNLANPATAWWTLAGTANATASPTTDAGFLDQIGGSVRFSSPTSSGGRTGVYSPDTPALPSATVGVLDAYIAKPGDLFFVLTGRSFASFQMAGNAGQFTYQVASIRMTAGGSSYSASPTATLTGGTPTRAAVLGTPLV